MSVVSSGVGGLDEVVRIRVEFEAIAYYRLSSGSFVVVSIGGQNGVCCDTRSRRRRLRQVENGSQMSNVVAKVSNSPFVVFSRSLPEQSYVKASIFKLHTPPARCGFSGS